MTKMTYKEAGVDIDAGEALVERIRPAVRATMRPEVLAGVGGFASLVSLPKGYKEPVLVSGTDGVGTKLKLAFALEEHSTVGIDLVAMCVNDILATGAEPLFFLDYYACSRLSPAEAASVIEGIAEGCRQAGCALVGGETAELPGFYKDGEYDLAGFAVGVVEKNGVVDGRNVRLGDAVIGLASSGLHSNGYSLARAVVDRSGAALEDVPEGFDVSLGSALLAPTRIYVEAVQKLMKAMPVNALAHITGGGLTENLPRTLPEGMGARLEAGWSVPKVFRWLADNGPVEPAEMLRTFNMGIGMTAVVRSEEADRAVDILAERGVEARVIGEIVEVSGDGPRVLVEGDV